MTSPRPGRTGGASASPGGCGAAPKPPSRRSANTGGPGELSHLYDETLMLASFPGYHVLELRTYEAHVQEGAAHQGMSGLLGFAAIKPA